MEEKEQNVEDDVVCIIDHLFYGHLLPFFRYSKSGINFFLYLFYILFLELCLDKDICRPIFFRNPHCVYLSFYLIKDKNALVIFVISLFICRPILALTYTIDLEKYLFFKL